MEREIDRWIGAASAVMQILRQYIEVSRKVNLSIYQSLFVPTLTYGHKLWVVTERTRLWVQAAEMGFLCRVEKVGEEFCHPGGAWSKAADPSH